MLHNHEKQQAEAIREVVRVNYKNLGENLGDFDHALVHMRAIRNATADYIRLGIPYVEKGIEIAMHGKFFTKIRAAHCAKEGSRALTKASKIIFDEKTVKIYNKAMAKDPRIQKIHFDVNVNDNVNEVNHHVTKSVKSAELTKITFADNTVLEIHSLDNLEELARAREHYNNKLNELGPRNNVKV